MERLITKGHAILNSYLPVEYQDMWQIINGLVLTRSATEGQTAFALPTSATVCTAITVWKNLDCPYRDRIRRDAEAATLNVGGTIVTLTTAATEGDIVVADVTHNGTNVPEILKQLLIDLLCAKLQLENMQSLALDGTQHANAQDLMTRTREDLTRLQTGKMRISEWDRLDLVDDTETAYPESGIGTVDFIGW